MTNRSSSLITGLTTSPKKSRPNGHPCSPPLLVVSDLGRSRATKAVVEMWNWPYIRRRSIFQVLSLRRKDVAIGVGGVVSDPAGSDIHARWAMVVDRWLSVDGR